jgi:hypothetical protein
MKATRFEFQHQTLLHLLVVGLSLVTYLAGPDANARQFVSKGSKAQNPLRFPRILSILAVGLLPLSGVVILIACETRIGVPSHCVEVGISSEHDPIRLDTAGQNRGNWRRLQRSALAGA